MPARSHPPAPDFERIFEAVPGLYLVLTPDLEIVAVSDAYLAATRTRRDAIVGRGLFDVFPDNPGDPTAAGKRNLTSSLQRVLDLRQPDTMAVQKYGERFISPINSPVLGADGRIAYIIHRLEDVTELMLLEQQGSGGAQLSQAQKLEAVGRLAGGIAHDFNNLLTVILSYAESSLEGLGEHHECSHGLREIRRAGERATELTRQLLAFSRQQVLDPRLLDLNEVLSEMLPTLERVLGESIGLTASLAPDLHNVNADRSKIEQVVMNLVLNARDAMPGGGRLTIESANVILSEEYAQEHPGVTAGPHVMLVVNDSGVGMDRTTRSRVFEPFFTTKEYGKGSGLGLSTVFGIVKQSGGHIGLQSELGRGTTFRIYFPRALAAQEAALPRAPLPDGAREQPSSPRTDRRPTT